MNRVRWNKSTMRLACLLMLILVLGGCSAFSSSKFPDKTPAPAFSLESIEGEQISLENTNGKARLLYFFFSNCPDVCPPTTHLMSLIQDGLKEKGVFGDKTALISITFDPERDTVERLREFSSWYGADYSGWYFLRGEEAVTREVAESYGVNTIPMPDGSIAHQNLYVLVDKEGQIRHHYLIGMDLESVDIDEIVEDLIYLANE